MHYYNLFLTQSKRSLDYARDGVVKPVMVVLSRSGIFILGIFYILNLMIVII